MYGIGRVKKKGVEIGYIEKNSFDLGGQKPESTKIEAEQVPNAPVLVIPQKNGSIAPTFNMIQLNYANIHALLGGNIHKKKGSESEIAGWTAPSTCVILDGPWELELVSGQSVLIPNATLLSNLGGKLTLIETSKIECTLEVSAPTEKDVPPYGVFDSDALPEEWEEYSLPKESNSTIALNAPQATPIITDKENATSDTSANEEPASSKMVTSVKKTNG